MKKIYELMFSSNYDICSISDPNLVMYDKLTLIQNYVFWIFQKSNCLSSSAAKIVDTNDIPHNFSQLSVRVISTFNSFHVVFFFMKTAIELWFEIKIELGNPVSWCDNDLKRNHISSFRATYFLFSVFLFLCFDSKIIMELHQSWWWILTKINLYFY